MTGPAKPLRVLTCCERVEAFLRFLEGEPMAKLARRFRAPRPVIEGAIRLELASRGVRSRRRR